jgi:hypothetical protein
MTTPEISASQEVSAKVDKVLSEVKKDENGKTILPPDISPEVEFAAKAEIRRRDTQGAYTKATQENAGLVKEKEALLDLLNNNVTFSEDQKRTLEELKLENPDEWRKTYQEFEKQAKNKLNKEVEEQLNNVSQETKNEMILAERKATLTKFLSENAGIGITEEKIELYTPKIFGKELENGTITFNEFLNKSKDFLTAKTGDGVKLTPQPNLNAVGGSNTPVKGNEENSYNSFLDTI